MRKALKYAFVAAMVALCLLPLASMLCGYQGKNLENRPLAQEPSLFNGDKLNTQFPIEFDDYFDDHFGLREEMVTLINALTEAIFGDTLNDKVVIGKDDMYFYSETMGDYTGTALLSDGELMRAAKIIKLLSDSAETSGATFAFTIAPNKNSIYPEYMPDYILKATDETNRERLAGYLRELGVDYIDLYGELTALKAQADEKGELIYYVHDTHWNMRGAILFYRDIMDRLGGEYEPYDDSRLSVSYDYSGDLHCFVSPAAEGQFEDVSYLPAGGYEIADKKNPERDSVFETYNDKNSLSLMLYRDSFVKVLVPYISSEVGRVRYSTVFPYDFTDIGDGFDAVIIELVERNIPNLTKHLPTVYANRLEGIGDITGDVEAYGRCDKKKGRIFGCFDAYDYNPLTDTLAVMLNCGGRTYVYEAFPMLDSSMEVLAREHFGDAYAQSGFALTLPEDMTQGEYSFSFILLRSDTAVGSGDLGTITIE